MNMDRRYVSPWHDLKHFPTASFLKEVIETLRPLPPLDDIEVPVLLFQGETYADPVRTRRAIERFQDVTTVTIDAHHWPLTEKPVEVRERIEKWCAAKQDSSRSRS